MPTFKKGDKVTSKSSGPVSHEHRGRKMVVTKVDGLMIVCKDRAGDRFSNDKGTIFFAEDLKRG